jgi:hypothetical protein
VEFGEIENPWYRDQYQRYRQLYWTRGLP